MSRASIGRIKQQTDPCRLPTVCGRRRFIQTTRVLRSWTESPLKPSPSTISYKKNTAMTDPILEYGKEIIGGLVAAVSVMWWSMWGRMSGRLDKHSARIDANSGRIGSLETTSATTASTVLRIEEMISGAEKVRNEARKEHEMQRTQIRDQITELTIAVRGLSPRE